MVSANGAAGMQTADPSSAAAAEASESHLEPKAAADSAAPMWPGWPGYNVFRLIVSVTKVGTIIGRKGDVIRKMCEETGAKIRILDGIAGTTDRVVLITGKEEPGAELPPTMDAVLRVFKRANGLEDEGASEATVLPVCSVRLLVASSQAICLIGKSGVTIKGIQEESGASVKILGADQLPLYANSDERIVDIQGESAKVIKALELVMGLLRKFLIDPSVIPLFDKLHTTPLSTSAAQDPATDPWADVPNTLLPPTSQAGISSEYASSLKREPLFLRDTETASDFGLTRSGISLYGQDPALSGFSSRLARTPGSVVIQVTQSMQIPLAYAEDIIGIGGANISYIRRTSGAIIAIQETSGIPEEITVEIKGTSSQVQVAQQLVQESISGRKEPAAYNKPDTSFLPSYSRLGSSYLSSSLTQHSFGGYRAGEEMGGYGGYRY